MPIVPNGSDFTDLVERLTARPVPLPPAMLPWLDCRLLTPQTLRMIVAELGNAHKRARLGSNTQHN
jgi:hypothetical protein